MSALPPILARDIRVSPKQLRVSGLESADARMPRLISRFEEDDLAWLKYPRVQMGLPRKGNLKTPKTRINPFGIRGRDGNLGCKDLYEDGQWQVPDGTNGTGSAMTRLADPVDVLPVAVSGPVLLRVNGRALTDATKPPATVVA